MRTAEPPAADRQTAPVIPAKAAAAMLASGRLGSRLLDMARLASAVHLAEAAAVYAPAEGRQ